MSRSPKARYFSPRRMLVSWCAVVAALLGPASAHATIVAFKTDRELYALADVVALAHVWQKQVVQARGEVWTECEVEVTESLKGTVAGHRLVLRTLGGTLENGVREFIAGSPDPEVGGDVLVFLKDTGDGAYYPLGMALGHYVVRYHVASHRYIAHREVSALSVVRPSPTRDGNQEVSVPADRLATQILAELRALRDGKGGAR